jgi:hypothetical protein
MLATGKGILMRLFSSLLFSSLLLNACTDHQPTVDSPPQAQSYGLVRGVPAWLVSSQSVVPSDVRTQALGVLSGAEQVVDYRRTTFEPTGQQLLRITTFDVVSQQSRKLVVDSAGALFDLEQAIFAAKAAHRAAYGALSPALHARASANPSARIDTELVFEVKLPIKPLEVDMNKYRPRIVAAITSQSAKISAWLKSIGAQVTWSSSSAPLLRVEATGKQLLSHVKAHPEVLGVKSFKAFTRQHHAAQSTTDLGITSVFYQNNYYGTGIKVGISGEGASGRCRLAPNPFFINPSIVYSDTATRSCTSDAECTDCNTTGGVGKCLNSICVAQHGTFVAGMVGHATSILTPRGAPLVDLFISNTTGWSHGQELDWLFTTKGVTVENESWSGAPDTFKQDYYPIIGLAITEASGNSLDADGSDDVSSCAANSICIGGYRTTADFYERGQTMNPVNCSRWLSNSCDMEVPHVTFHGQDATTTAATTTGQEATLSGTSLAAPAAAGLIALMNQRWSSTYSGWPEATRAALMASANVDVDQIAHTAACPTAGKTYSDYHCPDEKDGAGVPSAVRLEAMQSNSRVRKATLSRASSFTNNLYTFGNDVYLSQGRTLRAVLSWDACPKTSIPFQSGNGTHADLDLHVLDPSGNRVLNGASYDSAYEIGEFTASVSGYYRFEIQKFGWQDCPQLGGSNAYVYAALAFDVR